MTYNFALAGAGYVLAERSATQAGKTMVLTDKRAPISGAESLHDVVQS